MIDVLPDAYGVENRHARKDHKCCECRGVIHKGEHYFYHHGVWDYQGQSFKICLDCEHLRQEIDKCYDHWEDRSSFGNLYEDVFGIENIVFGRWYISTKIKRDAPIQQWMLDQLAKWEKRGF